MITKVLVAPAGTINELPKVNSVFTVADKSAVEPICVPSKYNFALLMPALPVVVVVAFRDKTLIASPAALKLNLANS